jgi:hypothetical protein
MGGGNVDVSIQVQDGRTWILGSVDITGDGLPLDNMRKDADFQTGRLANWKKRDSVDRQNDDGVEARWLSICDGNAVTRLCRENGIVNLRLEVHRGPQFLFASLQINGLNAVGQRQAMQLWHLDNGAPPDEPYIDELRSRIY